MPKITEFSNLSDVNENVYVPILDASEIEDSNKNKVATAELFTLNSQLKGRKGAKGDKGDTGISSYELWLSQSGNEGGTKTDYLNSLKGSSGDNGVNGESLYQIAVRLGFKGSEEEFLRSLYINPNY